MGKGGWGGKGGERGGGQEGIYLELMKMFTFTNDVNAIQTSVLELRAVCRFMVDSRLPGPQLSFSTLLSHWWRAAKSGRGCIFCCVGACPG